MLYNDKRFAGFAAESPDAKTVIALVRAAFVNIMKLYRASLKSSQYSKIYSLFLSLLLEPPAGVSTIFFHRSYEKDQLCRRGCCMSFQGGPQERGFALSPTAWPTTRSFYFTWLNTTSTYSLSTLSDKPISRFLISILVLQELNFDIKRVTQMMMIVI